MSSLFKRENGVYYVSFFDPDRKPSRRVVSARVKLKRDAEAFKARLDAGFSLGTFDPFTMSARDFMRGVVPGRARQDLSQLGCASEAFLASRSNLRPTTRERYFYIVTRFVEFAGREMPTRTVSSDTVQAWLNQTRTKPVTVNNYRRALSTMFRWFETENARVGDPTRTVRLPRVPQKHARYLSLSDVELICERIIEGETASKHSVKGTGRWLVPIVRANVYLGLRAGEIVNLKWEDVDLVRRTLTVRCTEVFTTKAGKDRTIPLPSPARDVINGLTPCSEFVFPSYSGKQLGRVYLSSRFKHFVRDAGLPEHVNFHTTRHTCASWLAERGASIEAIRLYLGHSSVTVTQRYMHLAPGGLASQIDRAFSGAG